MSGIFIDMKKYIVILVAIFFVVNINAQSVRKLEKAGDKAFKEQNYEGASYYYSLAINQSQSLPLAWKLAEAAKLNRNYKLAERWYLFVSERNSKKYPLAHFELAGVQKSMGQYQKAQVNYRNSYFQHRGTKSYVEKKSKHEITSCENALFLTFEPVDNVYKKMDSIFNSEYSDFQLQQIDNNTRYATVLRPEFSPDSANLLSRLIKFKNLDGNWKNTGIINDLFEDKDLHISSFTIDTSLKIMIFSACIPQGGQFSCNLFISNYKNGSFEKAKKISSPINISGYSTTHPHLTQLNNQSYLLFSSNRPGGEGKLDIWFAKLNNDLSFSQPVNPGAVINSIDDEVSPYYDSRFKVLYFSSEWFTNFDKLDVFSIRTDFETWGFVENLGLAVNSSYHDLFYNKSERGDYTFFSSNKPEEPGIMSPGCCNNLYYKYSEIPANDSLIIAERIIEIERRTRQLIPLNLFFHNDEPNPRNWDTTTNLSYEQTYNSYIGLIDEYREAWSAPFRGDEKINFSNQIESFFIDSVAGNFNKFKIFAEMLCELLENGKSVEITIKGFASPLNTSQYNTNLSKRRIQSLYNYLYTYKNSYMAPYIDGINENKLIIKREAFGRDKAASHVSSDLSDLRNSVYSPDAAKERRVAVIAVEL